MGSVNQRCDHLDGFDIIMETSFDGLGHCVYKTYSWRRTVLLARMFLSARSTLQFQFILQEE